MPGVAAQLGDHGPRKERRLSPHDDRRLAEPRAAADHSVQTAVGLSVDSVVSGIPEGHPLDSLRREGVQVAVLCAGLRAELERLG